MRFAIIIAVSGLIWASCPSLAQEHVNVIVDNYTGYAINGVDPVSYFTSDKPVQGRDEYEQRWGGVSWRFANEGNRQAFLVSPQIYMPQFGGYDPISLSRGTLTEGDPNLFLVYHDRVYFFFSVYTREDFLHRPSRTLRSAEQGWRRLGDGR